MELLEAQPRELAAYRNPAELLSLIERGGEMIKKSGMLGCRTVEQGQTMLLISVTEGISILECLRRYHIMDDGKLAMKADYMRAKFRAMGGDYDWIKDGEDGIEARCWIEFRGRRHEVSYTIDQAKKEGIVKAGSRWTKAPGDMLRARASTKAVRMYASEVLAGFCTDEELGSSDDEVVDGSFEVVQDQPPAAPAPAAKPSRKNGKAVAVSQESATAAAGVTDAPQADAGPSQAELDQAAAAKKAEINQDEGFCTGEQSRKINSLFSALQLPSDKIDGILARRNVKHVRSLKVEQADELIAKLNDLLAQKNSTAKEMPKAELAGPCMPAQIDEVKALLKEVEQMKPGTVTAFQSRLAIEKHKLADMSYVDAEALINALRRKALNEFLTRSLVWPANPQAPAPEPAAEGEPAKN